LFEKRAAVGVDAFVAEHRKSGDGVAEIGQGRAGKIQCKTVFRAHDLHDIGIGHGGVGRIERVGGSRHVRAVWHADCGGEAIDQPGVDERFVALDVDDMRSLWKCGERFGNAVGAGGMVWRGHHGTAAEGVDSVEDALVIGRDYEFLQGGAGLAAIPDVLDERFTSDEVEWFSGESCRAPSRGEDS